MPKMRVRDWMTPDPVTVTPAASVLNARRLLRRHGFRHLPVVADGRRVVGMLSDRDLLVRDAQVAEVLSALQSDLLWGRYRRIEAVMSCPVTGIGPDEPISDAASLMLGGRISALPVIDGGRLVGIITSTDCLRALLAQARAGASARRHLSAVEDDPDVWKSTPMPPGDQRPGRPAPGPSAPKQRASVDRSPQRQPEPASAP